MTLLKLFVNIILTLSITGVPIISTADVLWTLKNSTFENPGGSASGSFVTDAVGGLISWNLRIDGVTNFPDQNNQFSDLLPHAGSAGPTANFGQDSYLFVNYNETVKLRLNFPVGALSNVGTYSFGPFSGAEWSISLFSSTGRAINGGTIVGVLSPVPEPAAISTMLFGMLCIAAVAGYQSRRQCRSAA